MIKHGPVGVVAIAFGEPRFEGTVSAELEKQARTSLPIGAHVRQSGPFRQACSEKGQ
jgi:hypothetical protein